jgi:hypothetical protein
MTGRTAQWPGLLAQAVDVLDPAEQVVLLRSQVEPVRTLQVAGEAPPQRRCPTCRHFRPHAHPDTTDPHHCTYVDAPSGARHLRLNRAEQQDAAPEQQQAAWERFTTTGGAPDAPPS